MNEHLILDIGTGTVNGMIVRPTDTEFKILAHECSTYPGQVVREGRIVDVKRAATTVREIVDCLWEESSVQVRTAHFAVPGRGLQKVTETRSLEFDRSRSFREEDMEQLRQSRERPPADQLIIDEEIIQTLCDGESARTLVGQFGSHFTVKWSRRTLPMHEVENKQNVLIEADLVPGRVMLEPRAVISAFTPEDHRDLSRAVIDFGAGTIDLAYMEEGRVQDVETFIGSGDQLTQAIQDEFRVSFQQGEQIKKQAGESTVQGRDFHGETVEYDGDVLTHTITSCLKGQILSFNPWLEEHSPRLIFLAGGGSQFLFLPRMIARILGRPEEEIISNLPFHLDSDESDFNPADYTALGMARELGKDRGLIYLRFEVNDEPMSFLLDPDEEYTVADLLRDRGWETRTPAPESAMMIGIDGDWKTFRSDDRLTARVQRDGETLDEQAVLRTGDELSVDPPEKPGQVEVMAEDLLPEEQLRVSFNGDTFYREPYLVDENGSIVTGRDRLEDGREYQRKQSWNREEILNFLDSKQSIFPGSQLWKKNGRFTRDQMFHVEDTLEIFRELDPATVGLSKLHEIKANCQPISMTLD